MEFLHLALIYIQLVELSMLDFLVYLSHSNFVIFTHIHRTLPEWNYVRLYALFILQC